MIITRKLKHVTGICLFYALLTPVTLTDEVSEFQYPCYVDVCTFPRQFCNSDKYERRCSPCAASLCRETRIPLACKYQCNKLINADKTTVKPTVSKESYSEISDSETSSLYLIVAYNAVVTTLFVILLLVLIACYVQRIRTKTSTHIRQNSYRSYDGQPEGVELLAGIQANQLVERIKRLERERNETRDNTPPSYRTLEVDQNRTEHIENLATIITQPTQREETRCRPEMTSTDTQTTPKSINNLSFDFNTATTDCKDAMFESDDQI